MPSFDKPGQYSDTDVRHFSVRREMLWQVSPQAPGKNIGEIVISSFGRRVVARVRGAEFRQHLVDDAGKLAIRLLCLRTIFFADRLPVQSFEFRIIE